MRISFKAVVVAGVLGVAGSASAAMVEVDQVRLYRGATPVDWLAGSSGSLIFEDHMNNGDPLTGPLFSDGSASRYAVKHLRDAADINLAVSESGNRLWMNPDYAIESTNAANTGSSFSLGLRLGTNTLTANRGLSQSSSFAAGAIFAYQAPAVGYGYGVRLTDDYSDSSDIIDLRIYNRGSGSIIYFRHQDFLSGTITDYASVSLAALPANAAYVGLGLAQVDAGSGVVNGYYVFSDASGAVLGNVATIGSTTIFNGEDHTQFELRALAPVPEPESYALLLAGLGLIGTLARWQRRLPG